VRAYAGVRVGARVELHGKCGAVEQFGLTL
jgi:hypothetical protein